MEILNNIKNSLEAGFKAASEANRITVQYNPETGYIEFTKNGDIVAEVDVHVGHPDEIAKELQVVLDELC